MTNKKEKKHLLETNKVFTFVKSEECNGVYFEVYLDDYSMSYFLAWRVPETGEIQEWCCGMCNDYHQEMEDIAKYVMLPY